MVEMTGHLQAPRLDRLDEREPSLSLLAGDEHQLALGDGFQVRPHAVQGSTSTLSTDSCFMYFG